MFITARHALVNILFFVTAIILTSCVLVIDDLIEDKASDIPEKTSGHICRIFVLPEVVERPVRPKLIEMMRDDEITSTNVQLINYIAELNEYIETVEKEFKDSHNQWLENDCLR